MTFLPDSGKAISVIKPSESGGRFSFRSIRTQLVVWNIVSLALLLGALGTVVHYAATAAIMSSIDDQLEERTRPHDPPGPHPGPPPDGGRTGENHPGDRGPHFDGPPGSGPPDWGDSASRHFFGPPLDDHHDDHHADDPYGPQMFDANGKTLEPSRHAVPWDTHALASAALGHIIFSSVVVKGVPLRVISRPFPPAGGHHAVQQAAYPLIDANRAINGLNRVLLILIPFALICAALVGMLLTGRVLVRVGQMAAAADHIRAEDLSARLPMLGQDEFSALAGTFNGLLSRLEIAFRRQAQMVDQQRRFTADASHELKTPLTIIRGNTSMMLGGAASQEEYHDSMVEIDRAASTMTRLVQDLLLLARTDAGEMARSRSPIQMQDVLERAVAAASRSGSAKISLMIEEVPLCLMGDADQLTRVFTNLLENAVRNTPATGNVSVRASRDAEEVVVQVADTGIGIAPEYLPHLGERFFRVDNARARQDGGTGLGLSICRGILSSYGGQLFFESALQVGTTVIVKIPSPLKSSLPYSGP